MVHLAITSLSKIRPDIWIKWPFCPSVHFVRRPLFTCKPGWHFAFKRPRVLVIAWPTGLLEWIRLQNCVRSSIYADVDNREGATILDKIKWNSKPPSPPPPPPQPTDETARRAKTRHFPILDLGGRGGLGFPFILSKIVAKARGKCKGDWFRWKKKQHEHFFSGDKKMTNAIATSKVKMSSSEEKKWTWPQATFFLCVSTCEFSGEHIPRMDSFPTYAYSCRVYLLEFFIVFKLKNV